MTDVLEIETLAASTERRKLQRHFGRFDILFFLICTIVGVDTIAAVAQGGGLDGPVRPAVHTAGSGPRSLGVINARLGTPVRVNVFSGIVASVVVVMATQITSGNAAKYFGAVLGVTISTTLISYLLIYPALWKLRRSQPAVPRPFRMPMYRLLTVVLMALVAIASVRLIAPGLGDSWFGSDFAPDGWTYAERFTYLWTEAIPVLAFIVVGVLFWWPGRGTRAQTVEASAGATQAD